MSSIGVFIPIAAILVLAKCVAVVCRRFGLPAVFGELLVGLALGPSLFGVIHETDILKTFSDIGVIMLMFIAGLETDVPMLRKVGGASFAAATGGVILPFVAGTGVGLAFGLPVYAAFFLGTALTATSVSISAETLQELGRLRTREGSAILGAAIIDDVMGVLVLAFVIGFGSGANIVLPILKMILFFIASAIIGLYVFPWCEKYLRHWHGEAEEAVLAVAIALVLMYSWAAEELGGLAAITGAYLLGVIISRTEFKHSLEKGVRSIGYGFFIPLFFVGIGLQASMGSVFANPALIGVVALLAVMTKIIGCGAGSLLGRMSARESALVGVGMISRGEVALVIAAIGLNAGVISDTIFGVIIAVTVFTTIITPVLLKASYSVLSPRPRLTEVFGGADAGILEMNAQLRGQMTGADGG